MRAKTALKRRERQIILAIKDVQNGTTYRSVARKQHIPKSTLWNRVHRFSVPKAQKERTELTSEEEQQILSMIYALPIKACH